VPLLFKARETVATETRASRATSLMVTVAIERLLRGRRIGATLDRNGLRPARYIVTDDEFTLLVERTAEIVEASSAAGPSPARELHPAGSNAAAPAASVGVHE